VACAGLQHRRSEQVRHIRQERPELSQGV
jgi:hypothetical protein